MGTRDIAEVVETFRRKFMEGAAGTAGRVADACAWLAANPGGMAPHDMGLEPARLVGGVPDGLSAAAVTADRRTTTRGWPRPPARSPSRTDAGPPPSSSCMATPSG